MKSWYELAKQYHDEPPTVEDVKKLKSTVTKACLHYLMGKICLAERYDGKNAGETAESIYIRIGREFCYSEPSMRRFAAYTKAVDRLQILTPEIVPDMFAENSRLSMENTIHLSKKRRSEIIKIVERLSDRSAAINTIFPDHPSHRPGTRNNKKRKLRKEPPRTVKDTPVYDPDAQVSSLTYTIPTWTRAVEYVFSAADFSEVSIEARRNLMVVLGELRHTADAVIEILTEESR